MYGSETYNAALSQPGWDKEEFDDSGWESASVVAEEEAPAGELVEQFQPAVKVIRRYPEKYLDSVCERDIYDLGQNISGMLRLFYRGKKGDVIRIYPAEKLGKDGDVDQVAKNWVTVGNCITCIVGADDTWQEYRMCFTYFAGRYFAVEKQWRLIWSVCIQTVRRSSALHGRSRII